MSFLTRLCGCGGSSAAPAHGQASTSQQKEYAHELSRPSTVNGSTVAPIKTPPAPTAAPVVPAPTPTPTTTPATKPTKAAKPAKSTSKSSSPYSSAASTALFDTYADTDEPDSIGPEGLERLCGDAGVSLEGALPLVLAWQLGASEMGTFKRGEWMSGMEALQSVCSGQLVSA
jgi:hypothetical protein